MPSSESAWLGNSFSARNRRIWDSYLNFAPWFGVGVTKGLRNQARHALLERGVCSEGLRNQTRHPPFELGLWSEGLRNQSRHTS